MKKKKHERGGIEKRRLTRHHIFARSLGATNHPDNIILAPWEDHKIVHRRQKKTKIEYSVIYTEKPKKEPNTDIWLYSTYWYKLKYLPDWFGVCRYSKKIFTVSGKSWGLLYPLMVCDIAISDRYGCEMKKKCLVTNCKYNKTTLETFLESFGITNEETQVRYVRNWNRITNWNPVKPVREHIKEIW